MVADKNNMAKTAEKIVEENVKQIDGELLLSIEKLQGIQDDLEKKVNEKVRDEALEVEQKYNVIRKPVYNNRNEIIKAIPDFWLTVVSKIFDFVSISELKITFQVFKYLGYLDVEDAKDVKSGYSITFHLSPNPYFEDGRLTKTSAFFEEGTTKITNKKCKEGKGLPNGVKHKKEGNKLALQTFTTHLNRESAYSRMLSLLIT